MDPTTLSIIGIIVSLAFIVVLALRGWHIILLAPLAVVIVALFSGMDILPALTGPYMKGFVNYAAKFYLIFLMGSIFGKVMEDSGAARSIAEGILKLVGRDNPVNAAIAIAAIRYCPNLRWRQSLRGYICPHSNRKTYLQGTQFTVAPLRHTVRILDRFHHNDHASRFPTDTEHHAHEVHGLNPHGSPCTRHRRSGNRGSF